MLVPDILHEPQSVRKKIREEFSFPVALGWFLVPALFKPKSIACLNEEGLHYGRLDFAKKTINPVYQQLLWEIGSSSYLRPLEKITQIMGLIPDSFMAEGGIFLLDDLADMVKKNNPRTNLPIALHHYLFLSNMTIVLQGKALNMHCGDVLLLNPLLDDITSLSASDNEPVFCAYYYQNKKDER